MAETQEEMEFESLMDDEMETDATMPQQVAAKTYAGDAPTDNASAVDDGKIVTTYDKIKGNRYQKPCIVF